MASSLIPGAIMVVLLIIASYIIMGGIINTSETLTDAQYDASSEISRQLGTDIRLNNSYLVKNNILWIDVQNVGRIPITYPLDLIIVDENHNPTYHYDVSRGEEFIDTRPRSLDTLNKGVLDPGEGVAIGIPKPNSEPFWAEVITENGVSSSSYLLYNITVIP